VPSAAAGIDYAQVEGRPGALRTTATQNLICALTSDFDLALLPVSCHSSAGQTYAERSL